MHLHRRHGITLLALAIIAPFGCGGPARAQASGDLTLVSEYAGRGVALYTRPALQLRIERDTDDGWYGGVFASPVMLEDRTQGQLTVYAGRAQRATSTLSWDAGVTRNTYSRDSRWNYHEFYAGLALQRASVRLFYSPAYYGEGSSLYLDLSGAYPLTDALRLAAHAGLLHPLGSYDGVAARDSADVRIALVTDIGDATIQAGWQARWRTYLPAFPRPHAFTASASWHF